jgi:hypothetical protein
MRTDSNFEGKAPTPRMWRRCRTKQAPEVSPEDLIHCPFNCQQMARASLPLFLTALVASCASKATAQTGFVGLTFGGGSGAVQLNELGPNGQILGQLSSIPVGQEAIFTDNFRCVPEGGFCQFLTHDAGATQSFHYNASDVSGREILRTPFPAGVVGYTLHVDMNSGTSFSAATTGNGKGTAIVSMLAGKFAVVLDTTKYGVKLSRGSATHCSNKRIMFVQLKDANGANPVIITVSLASASVTSVVPLAFPGFDALWADCNDQSGVDTLGGTVVTTSGSSTKLSYGTVGTGGVFVPGAGAALPSSTPPLAPNGLLTMGESTAFFAGVYPQGSAPGTNTSGYVALFDETGGVQFAPIPYYLAGAARYR